MVRWYGPMIWSPKHSITEAFGYSPLMREMVLLQYRQFCLFTLHFKMKILTLKIKCYILILDHSSTGYNQFLDESQLVWIKFFQTTESYKIFLMILFIKRSLIMATPTTSFRIGRNISSSAHNLFLQTFQWNSPDIDDSLAVIL